jgi:hypothetical protein
VMKVCGKECLDLMLGHTKMVVPNDLENLIVGCHVMEVNPMKMVK